MTHRWTAADVGAWRRLAKAALAAAADAERRRTGAVRAALLDELRRRARGVFKASFPAPAAEWPRFAAFLKLSEDYATHRDAWRGTWTAALDRTARELLARLGPDAAPPSPPAAAAQAGAAAPWWVDGK